MCFQMRCVRPVFKFSLYYYILTFFKHRTQKKRYSRKKWEYNIIKTYISVGKEKTCDVFGPVSLNLKEKNL